MPNFEVSNWHLKPRCLLGPNLEVADRDLKIERPIEAFKVTSCDLNRKLPEETLVGMAHLAGPTLDFPGVRWPQQWW